MKATNKSKSVKTSSKSKKQAPVVKQRVTILGHSATSIIKWMGAKGYTSSDATAVAKKLASDDLKPSTIATAISDGKNPKYNGSNAEVTKEEAARIKKIVTAAASRN